MTARERAETASLEAFDDANDAETSPAEAAPHAEDVEDVEDGKASETVAGTALRTLIVDDEADLRLLLRLQLGYVADFEVVGDAADGVEALALCHELRPDVVVMDLLMPKMTGFEATARLREELPEIGIVAYSAVAGDFAREEMERLGIELVLKSGKIDIITAALRRCVEGRD